MEREHRSAISVVFVLLLAGTMTAVAVAPDPQAQTAPNETAGDSVTTVSVSASGEVQAAPDLAVLHLESTATAADPQNATDRLAANVSQLRSALRQAGVAEDQIRTTEYNLYQESDRGDPDRPTNETRYVAQQGISVDVTNTSAVGELVDVAVANGATGVRNVEFTLSTESRADLRNQALEEAMGSARSQADTLAGTEDVEITGVSSISTGSDGPQPFVSQDVAASTESGTQIDSGPVTVQATVQVTYNATS